MKTPVTFTLILISFSILSCSSFNGEEKCSQPAPLNPNGDSELALLMREMFDDAMRMKTQIKNGGKPDVLKKFTEIHTAQPTEEGKTDIPEFKVYAQSYLQTIQAMQNADAEHAPELFHNVVESCMNCHRAMCPGPMVKIKKLYLEKGGK